MQYCITSLWAAHGITRARLVPDTPVAAAGSPSKAELETLNLKLILSLEQSHAQFFPETQS